MRRREGETWTDGEGTTVLILESERPPQSMSEKARANSYIHRFVYIESPDPKLVGTRMQWAEVRWASWDDSSRLRQVA